MEINVGLFARPLVLNKTIKQSKQNRMLAINTSMNLLIDPANYSMQYVQLLDPRQNMIMDGNFTKIMYATDCFTMNGLFLYFPVEIQSVQTYTPVQRYNREIKCMMQFDKTSESNRKIVEQVCEIEKRLMDYYVEYNQLKWQKRKIFSLSEQIVHGCAKFYSKMSGENGQLYDQEEGAKKFYIKISGVWENHRDIGITYKILEI